MFSRIVTAAAAALLLSVSAQATPLQATGGIFNGSGYGSSYTGAGGTTPLYNRALGQVEDGGNGAFDAFGFYNSGTTGLTQTRQVELLSGNVFRFFDSFTNNTSQVINTTLNFFGNLGSDGDELIHYNQGGLIVSCEDDWTSQCGNDPVLALVSGNNGLGIATITPDRYNVSFTVSIAPGAVLSLLNFAFLSSDEDGPTANDVDLALSTGLDLLDAPRLEGLTDAQLATLANFSLQHVPEPSSMLLMLTALAALGWRTRRKS
ncbi:PEP-CTERM sorting domain-containing protein [Variovorax sp. HJSM1_2]|uniref:PEP-CTERM sorting domain-containing protein n=1 Tax=Variovorax sp. HJSM1_2 TaxID=3366263 RepID=UPI003BE5EFD7